jgi:hypothetical protein
MIATVALAPAFWAAGGLPAVGGFVFGSAIALLNFRILGGQVRVFLARQPGAASQLAVRGFMLRSLVYAAAFTAAYVGFGLAPVAMALGALTLRVGILAVAVRNALEARAGASRSPLLEPGKGA